MDRFVLIDAGVFVSMQPFKNAPITLRARVEAAHAWASGVVDVVPTPPGSRQWFGFDGGLLGFGVTFPQLATSLSRLQFGVEVFVSYLQARSTSFSPVGVLLTIGMRSS